LLPLRPVVPLVVPGIYGLSAKCFVVTVVVAVHGVHGDEACGDPMSSCHVPVVPRRVGCCGPSWSYRPPPGDADVCQRPVLVGPASRSARKMAITATKSARLSNTSKPLVNCIED